MLRLKKNKKAREFVPRFPLVLMVLSINSFLTALKSAHFTQLSIVDGDQDGKIICMIKTIKIIDLSNWAITLLPHHKSSLGNMGSFQTSLQKCL